MTRYTRKELQKIAVDHVKYIRSCKAKGYKHTVKLYDWELIINDNNHAFMAVLFDDKTGLRQQNIAI